MKPHYNEITPSKRLAPYVECFWTLRTSEICPEYPVLPDGCVDIIFSRGDGQPTGLEAVGTMTRRHAFRLPAGQFLMGVRFRPALSPGFLRAPAALLTDASVALECLWGPAARRLQDQLVHAASVREGLAVLEAALHRQPEQDPVEKAVAWMVENRGQVSVEHAAEQAGMSARQFRRLCLEKSGVTPKQLCRILRFRRALSQMRPVRRPDWAQLALDCGYYDQAHFIRDFREFSGYSPGRY